ncbi:hypothetical protein GYMLUDRAFT_575891 [Collybiopsis luxurians FD-317 M1]|uniref:Uncharacterized protein n=1 Tax=Collybiopsis luxurians FD-317 M1 TaxID=944289 RepID=A0A0D0C0N9_9AGAR|nr:hypothetical protein GYMLUDRAFT_575891 [Collybiopsis luxurians FD-317 M1]
MSLNHSLNSASRLTMKTALLSTFSLISLASASSLLARQTNTCDSSNACTAPGGCTGTCAPATPQGGPAVCVDICGEGNSIFCPACFAGSAESDGAPCAMSSAGDCTLVN